MIKEKDILPRLVQACPEYGSVLNEFLHEETDAGRSVRVTYSEVGDFARWLVGRVADGAITGIQPFGTELERLLTEGDEETRQFATIGLIEDIQEGCVETGVDPDLFMHSLGPVSRDKWFAIVRFKFARRMDRWPGTVE